MPHLTPDPRRLDTAARNGPAPGGRVLNLLPSALLWLTLFVCCGLPLLWLVAQIVANPVSLSGLRMDAFRWGILGRTLGYNAGVAVIATVLALPAALVLGRGRGRLAAALWFFLPVTLLLPSLAYAYGWAQVVHLVSGPAGRVLGVFFRDDSPALAWLGILLAHTPDGAQMRLDPAGRADVFRCVWSLATWLWALPAGIIGLALRRTDADLQQQALLDGALWRITARQLLGPVVASVACVTVLAVQEFSVYEPTGISVVATEVRQVFQTGAFSSPSNPITAPMGAAFTGAPVDAAAGATDGATGGQAPGLPSGAATALPIVHDVQKVAAAAAVATALPLLAIIAILGGIAAWGVRKVAAAGDVDAGAWPAALDAGRVLKALACLALGVTVVVPTAGLLVAHNPKAGWDLDRIWNSTGLFVLNSVFYGFLTGMAAFCIAVGASLRRHRGGVALALSAFLVGGQLLAIALIRLYNRRWLGLDAWVYDAPPVMVMAYLARFGWLVLLAAGATWSRPWRALRDMAAVDGAGPGRTALYVVWPLAWPLLAGSAFLVMILALTEVPATVLLMPLRPQPVVSILMTWLHMQRSDDMIEASLQLMLVVVVLAGAAVGLIGLGLRLWSGARRPAGRGMPGGRFLRILIPLALLALLSTGCRDPKQPEAVWLETGTAPGQVVYPRAITYAKDDTFFVIDRVARVQHLDHDGKFLAGWQMPEWKNGKPVGVSVGPDGNVYVPDTHYHRVVVYSPTGQLLRQWGKDGTGDGEFIYPTDVAWDEKGNLFVSEYGDHDRVQVFDPTTLRKLYQFGSFGTGDGQFSRPQSMVIDKGLVYITDACNHRLCVFKTDGTFVRNMGSVGSDLGQFRYPYGLDMDADGRLIVCEFGNNRVQLVDKATGKGLKAWGSAGREPGELAYPWGVAVDKHDRVVAVDAGNNRLQVFEF